jgi:pimeloyl-ACP methyl ester carboxylesterase
MLALHGWLDNAASFDRLAPLLTGCHLFSLDSAGHGSSDPRPPGAAYNVWQEVGDVLDVADRLGWERFDLIGHSRGAAVAVLLAGAFPDRVEKLVLLEGGVPILGRPEEAPADLARGITQLRELSGKTGRLFATEAAAIEERANGFSKVSLDAAAVLARRSLRKVEGGYRWHQDQRLKASSELRLTAEQMRAFIGAVTAPVLTILAEQSFFSARREYLELLELFAEGTTIRLPGGHHFHMEGAEHEIARLVRRFQQR